MAIPMRNSDGAGKADFVFEGAHTRALGVGLDRETILYTFDSLIKDRVSFPAYAPVMKAVNRGMGHVSIQSARNDWFLNSDLADLKHALAQYSRGKEGLSIGFSMGGYGALLLGRQTATRRFLLFSPQYSIFPEVAPYEKRYLQEASVLDPALDVVGASGYEAEGYIFHDPILQPVDNLHAEVIARKFTGLRKIALAFGGHPPTKIFPDVKGYMRIMEAFLDNRMTPGFARKLHKEARLVSPRYSELLQKYLRSRSLRGRIAAP